MAKCKSTKIVFMQKINLGGYETRDIGGEIEMQLEDGDDLATVRLEARQFLADEVGQYYRDIKGTITGVPKVDKKASTELAGHLKTIELCQTTESLKKLEEKITALAEGQNKDMIFAAYNKRMIVVTA